MRKCGARKFNEYFLRGRQEEFMKRLCIFVSGSGTNMDNLIKVSKAGQLGGAKIALVVCDNPAAAAIDKARKQGVPVAVFERKKFADKAAFEAAIAEEIEKAGADWLVLAGYMRILSCDFVRQYRGRIINVHPSLLPAFPGAHGIKDAFEAKVRETGVTIHFVDEGVDTGPVILQRKVSIDPQDTLETLEEKVHRTEYELYPEALRLVLSGKVRLPGHHREDETWEKD